MAPMPASIILSLALSNRQYTRVPALATVKSVPPQQRNAVALVLLRLCTDPRHRSPSLPVQFLPFPQPLFLGKTAQFPTTGPRRPTPAKEGRKTAPRLPKRKREPPRSTFSPTKTSIPWAATRTALVEPALAAAVEFRLGVRSCEAAWPGSLSDREPRGVGFYS